ncbi:MAG TPA: YceH family protein [Gaiellaceae bacterium]|nr:YceH family protein [Gaiellaceae bacterium]
MSAYALDEAQQRVLGCLVEKQRTTPDQYPLSLNALRLACNQTTSRDPVLSLDESEVRAAVQRLGQIGFARLASGPGSRAAKYRHLLDEALGLDGAETAVLAVLLLRGPQTASELKARAERLGDVGDALAVLERLARRELVEVQPRQPGRREERWAHLLGGGGAGHAPASTLEERLRTIEERLGELERTLAERGLL